MGKVWGQGKAVGARGVDIVPVCLQLRKSRASGRNGEFLCYSPGGRAAPEAHRQPWEAKAVVKQLLMGHPWTSFL